MTPVDQASFAELITRFAAIQDQYLANTSLIAISPLNGPGPVTIDPAGQTGKRLRVGNGSSATTIVVNLPSGAPVGTVILWRQAGTAQLKFVAASGVTLIHRLGHNASAAQHAGGTLTVEAGDTWFLDGDTAAI